MLIALLFLMLSVCGSALYLFSLTLPSKHISNFEAGEYFQKQGLPASGLERYRLLQADPDGVAMEQIKEAARRKLGTSRASRTERILLINGYEYQKERQELAQNIALTACLVSAITFCALILQTGAAMAISAAALALPLSLLAWMQFLSLQAKVTALNYASALSAIIPTLRKILNQGFDLGTTLEMLLKQHAMEKETNLALITLEIALVRSKSGYPLNTCLKDACRETGIAQMNQLAGMLSLLDQHGAPWTVPFKELQDNVHATLRAEAERPKPREPLLFRIFKK